MVDDVLKAHRAAVGRPTAAPWAFLAEAPSSEDQPIMLSMFALNLLPLPLTASCSAGGFTDRIYRTPLFWGFRLLHCAGGLKRLEIA
jgi:hypothetical protein